MPAIVQTILHVMSHYGVGIVAWQANSYNLVSEHLHPSSKMLPPAHFKIHVRKDQGGKEKQVYFAFNQNCFTKNQ